MRFIVSARLYLLAGLVTGIVLAIAIVLSATPTYRAFALVVRAEHDSSGIQDLLGGRIGGVAALAGIGGSLGRGDAEAQALLQSRETVGMFIDANNLLPKLFPKAWDESTQQWKPSKLTQQERRQNGISRFRKSILSVERERATGLLTVAVEWRDPGEASAWANAIVALANDIWRRQVIHEAEQSIEHFTDELSRTGQLEVREGIYRLVESNMKQLAVATVRKDLLFKVLDKASIPTRNERVWPKPVRLLLMGGLFGGALGLLIAFLRLIWH